MRALTFSEASLVLGVVDEDSGFPFSSFRLGDGLLGCRVDDGEVVGDGGKIFFFFVGELAVFLV